MDAVGSTNCEPSLVERQRCNRGEVGAMEEAWQKPIPHDCTMRKRAEGLDAQGGPSAKSAITQIPNRKPPSVSGEAGLGVRSDLDSFGHSQLPPLASETEVNSEFPAMVGGRICDNDDAGERAM
jgi:hypothetical protein